MLNIVLILGVTHLVAYYAGKSAVKRQAESFIAGIFKR